MDFRAIFMGLAFALMWSSAFTSARIIVMDAPPLGALALRFLVSGIIAVLLALALGQTWKLTLDQWRATFIFGLSQNAIYLGLNFVAMQTIEASLASIIASTMPLLVALASWMVLRERLHPIAIAGLVAGICGVLIIMGARIEDGVDMGAVALCGIASIALAIATLSVRGATSQGNLLMVVGLQMFVGSAILAVASYLSEDLSFNPSWRLGLAFTYTTIVPGVMATWVWFTLVNRIGAIRAATFHFLNPVFGVAIAALLLGEKIRPLDIVGVAIITAGILAVQLTKLKTT